MSIGQILDKTRSCYLKQFSEAVTKFAQNGQRTIAEAAFRDEKGALVEEGELSLPLRGDIFVSANGQQPKLVRVDSETILSFEPFSIELNDSLKLQITPFYWDACDIYVSGISTPADRAHLKKWFVKWFDVEDLSKADAQGFFGVIHFLSDPKFDGSTTEFQVDFGSAPVESFKDLFDTLKDLGATKVQIGRR